MTPTPDEALVYGFDPLCGWCFGFRPTMQAVLAQHADLPVELLCGGLVLGERVRPVAADRAYLVQGLERVKQVSGVEAGAAFYEQLLAAGTYVSNSEPPCRAIVVMQQLAPAKAYAFADSLPHAYYGLGQPLDDGQVLQELVAAQGVEAEAFLQHWQSDEAKASTEAAFAHARSLGIGTYPTLLYRRGREARLIAQGWLDPQQAAEAVALARRS